MREFPQGRSSGSTGSPKQIADQPLSLLVVAENLRSCALDAGQMVDRLRVVALSGVGQRGLKVNLAAAADEPRSEAVGVDLIGDLHRSIWLVEAQRGGQRMGADVGRSKAGPRVVAVCAKTLGEVPGFADTGSMRLRRLERRRRSRRSTAGRRAPR